MVYTSMFNGRFIPVCLMGGTIVHAGILGSFRKMLKFPEGKELFLTNMVDTRETVYTLVPKYQREIRCVEIFQST